MRDPLRVLERIFDVDVSVQADGTEVDDAGRAAHHVGGDPDLAECPTKVPGGQVVEEGERHDDRGNQEVCNGQANQEQVG